MKQGRDSSETNTKVASTAVFESRLETLSSLASCSCVGYIHLYPQWITFVIIVQNADIS